MCFSPENCLPLVRASTVFDLFFPELQRHSVHTKRFGLRLRALERAGSIALRKWSPMRRMPGAGPAQKMPSSSLLGDRYRQRLMSKNVLKYGAGLPPEV